MNILIHRIHEHRRPRNRRLGRQIVHDPRSREFVVKMARAIKSVRHEAVGLPLDQGEVGSCTGNAAAGALNSEPYFDKLGKVQRDEQFALDLYHDETELHPRDGVYPPEDPGGCGLWVAKVLKHRGLIKAYRHAFGIDQALRAVVRRPCIFGIDWYSSFDDCDEVTGLVEISPTARIEGGHEIVADEIDAPNKLIWFWQSWGKWGYKMTGRFCMTWDTLDRLLQNQGDCTQFNLTA